jgi:hypothetical protein
VNRLTTARKRKEANIEGEMEKLLTTSLFNAQAASRKNLYGEGKYCLLIVGSRCNTTQFTWRRP